MSAVTADRVPTRAEVPAADTWDLARLFPTDAAWEAAFAEWEAMIDGYARFRGRLGEGPEALAECLRFDTAVDRLGDRVGTYAFLEVDRGRGQLDLPGAEGPVHRRGRPGGRGGQLHPPGDPGDPRRPAAAVPRAPALADTSSPSNGCCATSRTRCPRRKNGCWPCRRRRPRRPRRCSTSSLNADLKFGTIEMAPGKTIELSHGSYAACLENPDRDGPQEGVPPVLRGVRRPRQHVRGDAGRVGQAGRVLRPGAELPVGPRGGPVPRQRAGQRLRQPDRRRPGQPAGRPPVLPAPPAADEAAGHPLLRHLRADPDRHARSSAPGTRRSRRRHRLAAAARPGVHRRAGEGPARPVVRPLREQGQAQRGVLAAAATTATRTS